MPSLVSLLSAATWPLGPLLSMSLDAAAASSAAPSGLAPPASARARGRACASLGDHFGMQVAAIPRLLLSAWAYAHLLGDWRGYARELAPAWVAAIVARYVLLMLLCAVVTDGAHLSPVSPWRASMSRHKYSARYPALFERAGGTAPLARDAAWSCLTAAMAGLLEAAVLHACAAGRLAFADTDAWWTHAPTVVLMATWFYSQNVQFYAMHRCMHRWGVPAGWFDPGAWLYKHVHSLHHQAKNPSAVSGIAMHPVEAALYLSYALFPCAFAAHPIAVTYILHNLVAAAMLGHSGFEDPAQGSHPHFIHHQLVHVNYAENHLPIDWALGTFAATEEDAHASLQRRLGISDEPEGAGAPPDKARKGGARSSKGGKTVD